MLRWSWRASVAGLSLSVALIAAPPRAAADPDTACTGDGLVLSAANRTQVEQALLCLVNRYRQDNLAPPLQNDTRLSAAAFGHSQSMNLEGYFEHDNPDPPFDTPDVRAGNQGYAPNVGENLGANGATGVLPGFATAWSLFDQWRNSPEHNENMLDPDYVASGLGADPGCWCSGNNYGVGETPGIGIVGTQMFGLDPPNTSATDINLNFAAIPGSTPKGAPPAQKSPETVPPRKCHRKKRHHRKRPKCRQRPLAVR